MPSQALLDISRLISCAGRPAPSGIDRVELAYARRLLEADTTAVCAMAPWGRLGLIGNALAARYIEALATRWQGGSDDRQAVQRLAQRLQVDLLMRGEAALFRRIRGAGGPMPYLLVSHHHLAQPGPITRLLQAGDARFICLIHDLIPVTHAEYARAGQPELHTRRMQTAASLADGVIVNSRATAAEFAPFLEQAGRNPPVVVAPLGVELATAAAATEPDDPRPYFLCVSTIEPRKNHLLLLNLWRELAGKLGPQTPRLILMGRRGWENENVIDMIERCQPIRGIVEEHNLVADAELARLLGGARALLLPSFAEGYGLPVAEALAAGLPVLCSDLPALREVGGSVPEYLDPLDGPAWRAAVLDYARPDSSRREAQLRRLPSWTQPRWSAHFEAVERLIDRACASAIPDRGTHFEGQPRAAP